MNRLLDIIALGSWLGRSPSTIKSDLCRSPQILPKGFKIGREWRWREEDVIAWIEAQVRNTQEKFLAPLPHSSPDKIIRRAGRPTKADEIARRKVKM